MKNGDGLRNAFLQGEVTSKMQKMTKDKDEKSIRNEIPEGFVYISFMRFFLVKLQVHYFKHCLHSCVFTEKICAHFFIKNTKSKYFISSSNIEKVGEERKIMNNLIVAFSQKSYCASLIDLTKIFIYRKANNTHRNGRT